MSGADGEKIKLSWQQLVWGISILSVILLTYSDLKNTVKNQSEKINEVYAKLQQENKRIRSNLKVVNRRLKIETGED